MVGTSNNNPPVPVEQLPSPPNPNKHDEKTVHSSPSPSPKGDARRENNSNVDYEFLEEPLGLPEDQSFGFPQLEFGQRIGPTDFATSKPRYKIARKLGYGRNSSVWLAFDESGKKYVAIKALTGYQTRLLRQRLCFEDTALELVSRFPSSPHCVSALTHFVHPGKVAQDGMHQCFVTDVFGGDVRALQKHLLSQSPSSNGTDEDEEKEPKSLKALPLPLVKRILYHTLLGLAHLHARGVVHTDLKPDNIMFTAPVPPSTDNSSLEIQQYYERILADDPPKLNPPEPTLGAEGATVRSAVSQPLPLPGTIEEAMERVYLIADLGSAQLSKATVVDEITPHALRAPETILRGPWDEKVDIWVFGCLVFELVTHAPLFQCKPLEEYKIAEPEAAHLWQMMLFTKQLFKPDQLQISGRALDYFGLDCRLKSKPPLFYQPISESIQNYGVLDNDKEIEETEALILRCLKLDPTERPSAEDLLSDKWWDGIAKD